MYGEKYNSSVVVKRAFYELQKGTDPDTNEQCLIARVPEREGTGKYYALLQQELHLTSFTDDSRIVRAKYYTTYPGAIALVMECFDGVPVERAVGLFHKDHAAVIRMGISISKILSGLHRNAIVHRSIDCRSILACCGPGQSEYTFALTFLGVGAYREGDIGMYCGLNIADYMETMMPAYISPELTGMVDIVPDHRADLYSLGILLYEMFTGNVPFRAEDTLETLHFHVAHDPVSPRTMNPSIPGIISEMVMLLLEKDPVDRYESASALQWDLERCLRRLRTDGTIREFTPGVAGFHQAEAPATFLVGRHRERQELLSAISVDGEYRYTALFVAGYAGTGKTALVNSLRETIHERKGWFISGKHDQFRRDIPYAVLAEIIRGCVQQILLSENNIGWWNAVLTNALNPNTGLLVSLVPELESITGLPGPVPFVDPVNAEKRYLRTLREFLRIVAECHAPLVLFFDDLQWADRGSLHILRYITANDPVPGLFIIGAYRDNEVNDAHPLTTLIDDMYEEGLPVRQLFLHALDREDAVAMITARLEISGRDARKFAAAVFQKTGGNPFFIREFLRAAGEEGVYNAGNGNKSFVWDPEGMRRMPVTENVVDLLSEMITDLDDDDKRVMKTAACIGSTFEATLLSSVIMMEEHRVAGKLDYLVKKDYLLKKGQGRYAFMHDRVQEAVYRLLAGEERAVLHRKIAGVLLELYGEDEIYEHLFEIADHLNECAHTASMEDERRRLITVNENAGHKAKDSVAFGAAIRYFQYALMYFAEFGDCNDRTRSYELRKNLGESLYLDSRFDEAEKVIFEAMEFADNAVEKASLYNILIIMKTINSEFDEAIDAGITALNLLGMEISSSKEERISRIAHEDSFIFENYLKSISVQSITSLPECDNENIMILQKILRNIGPPGYLKDDESVLLLMPMKIISLSFEHGLTPESSSGFVSYGVLKIQKGEYEIAQILGKAAYIIAERSGDLSQICEVSMKYGFLTRYWIAHLRESNEYLRKAKQAGIKSGDYIYAGWAVDHLAMNNFNLGVDINQSIEFIDCETEFCKRIRNQQTVDFLTGIKMMYANILGQTSRLDDFDLPELTESTFIQDAEKRKSHIALATFYMNKSFVFYLNGDYKESLKAVEKAENLSVFNSIVYYENDVQIYKSLVLSALSRCDEKQMSEKSLAYIEHIRSNLDIWSHQCPENFIQRYYLLEAEYARIDNRPMDAINLYDRAIAAARNNEYRQIEAIACERAGEFWLTMGKKDFAALYLKRALQLYEEWGAIRKVSQLREAYEGLPGIVCGSTEVFTNNDILALLKAFNIISGHSSIEGLIEDLTLTVISHSGAERFIVLMKHRGAMVIQAWSGPEGCSKKVLYNVPLEDAGTGDVPDIPLEMVRYVQNTGAPFVVHDGAEGGIFRNIPYMERYRPMSALCMRTETVAGEVLWYLENRKLRGIFSSEKIKILVLLARQASICIQNALYREDELSARPSGASSNYTFRHEGIIRIIPYEKIVYFSSHSKHTVIHTVEGTFDTAQLLKNIENTLPVDMFVRIHKQYIVNVRYVSSLKRDGSGRFVMYLNDEDDTRLPTGRAYFNSLNTRFML